MTQTQVCLQLRAAQIEIAILQTQVFAGERLVRRVELKRQGARVVENNDLSCLNFHVAGAEFRIARAGVTHHHVAGNCQNIFAAHFFRLRVRGGGLLLIYDDLSDAFAVAQVDERKRTKVTPSRAPTHQHDAPAYVVFAQSTARVRAFKISEVLNH